MKNEKVRKIKMGDEEITVIIDPALDKYDNVVLFPEKLAECNKTISEIGMPAQYYLDQKNKK
jgi:hypothetical protein